MRICLASSEHGWWGGIGYETRRLATLLGATDHEVTLIQAGESNPDGPRPAPPAGVREVFAQPSPELARIDFACDLHRSSAAVMEAIEGAYEGGPGPDYLEVIDYHANGLVPLQARRAGHPLLRDTLIAVRASATAELLAVHDGTLYQPEMELVAALEREQFRLADRLVWRGGDTLNVYRRYYADLDLPEAALIPAPFERPASPPAPPPGDTDRPLEILFVGKLQRVKGALDLVEACLGLDDEGWRLTMIGADTETAPAGQSVRMTIEAMCGDDPRVSLLEPLPHDELQRADGAVRPARRPLDLRGLGQRRGRGDASRAAGARQPGRRPGGVRRARGVRLAHRRPRPGADPPGAESPCWRIALSWSGCAPRGRSTRISCGSPTLSCRCSGYDELLNSAPLQPSRPAARARRAAGDRGRFPITAPPSTSGRR